VNVVGSPDTNDDPGNGRNTLCCADHFDDPISNISKLILLFKEIVNIINEY
jgi:hypothetical protein